MKFLDSATDRVEGIFRRLDDQEKFRSGFDLTLPPIDRPDGSYDVYTSCKFPLHESIGNLFRFFATAGSSQHHACICHQLEFSLLRVRTNSSAHGFYNDRGATMAAAIKFGTSGWRSLIAEDFTFSNVRRAVTGIAKYVTSVKPESARVIVGRDPRFLGEQFTSIAADVLAAHGVTPMLIAEPAPTPAISFEVIRTKADGAINITASHNPPEYNGI